jgi:hypothetical protein
MRAFAWDSSLRKMIRMFEPLAKTSSCEDLHTERISSPYYFYIFGGTLSAPIPFLRQTGKVIGALRRVEMLTPKTMGVFLLPKIF